MTHDDIITEGELFDYLEEVSAMNRLWIVRVPASGPLTILSSKDNLKIDEYELMISDAGKHGWKKVQP